jgi:Isy1-like splicing family
MAGRYRELRDISTSTHYLCSFLRFSPNRSHRYFGRAKELPGVKELFESRKKEEDEENATSNFSKKFTNQGPAYFGDLDEADEELLKYEEAAEQAGNAFVLWSVTRAGRLTILHARQSGRKRTRTCVKSLTFPPTHLLLKYHAVQAHPRPASRHLATRHLGNQTANARPLTAITTQCQNLTAKSPSARNQTRLCPLPVRRRPM